MLNYPADTTYWIITAGVTPVAGMTETDQVTTSGPGWTVLLQTTDDAEWRAECERLKIELPPAVHNGTHLVDEMP